MPDTAHTPPTLDPERLARAVADAAVQAEAVLAPWLDPGLATRLDPLGIAESFQAYLASLIRHPERLLEAQVGAWQQYVAVWHQLAWRMAGVSVAPVIAPERGDRRFRDPEWRANPLFEFIRQSYLVAAQTLLRLAAGAQELDPVHARKVRFYTQQYVDALAPTNFWLTNPEVLRATAESGGRNLVDGLKHLLEDLDPATGRITPRMVDTSAFELGRNIAATRGKVVFETPLMQLIQYAPLTAEVFRRPLLVIPPWINKYYILDLQRKNSFVRWLVERGHTVFMISWVNPDETLRHRDFEDYMLEGPLAALDAIERATGEHQVNVIGYCLGGTLLGATLAWLAAKGRDRVRAASFFTALLDFSDVGDIGVFIDERQVARLEELMDERGYLDGAEMATAFNLIRASDLIWSFVINNYLLGRAPAPFDLLYWNSDSTRMPARMHATYLREMYLGNRLREPGGLECAGVALDLRRITVPACFVSTVEDHIAPWKTTYLGAQLLGGPVTFILGKAGHVAGIVNPPGPRQYGHYTGPDIKSATADEWFAAAVAHPESWWVRWDSWIADYVGDKVEARKPGAGRLRAIENAPGRYVRVRTGAAPFAAPA